jgi:hypothetical protein
VGAVKELIQALIDERRLGSEVARQALVDFNSTEALRGLNPILDAVADYVDRGFSIVPQLPGAKCPCVRWKPYQTERPTVGELYDWYHYWPDAGIAVVLGNVSDLFAVDVDGTAGHLELVRHLGGVPKAPRSISGSGKPDRYHLFFRCPEFATKARATPWHPKLEFRGDRGIIVLPPSRHKSGRHYRWKEGRSLNDVTLPAVPRMIRDALQVVKEPVVANQGGANPSVVRVVGISNSTRLYLSGQYAFAGEWNPRLYAAACDLAGNGVSLDRATALLLAGAKPVSGSDHKKAIATIESAYSQPRRPAREFASRQGS